MITLNEQCLQNIKILGDLAYSLCQLFIQSATFDYTLSDKVEEKKQAIFKSNAFIMIDPLMAELIPQIQTSNKELLARCLRDSVQYVNQATMVRHLENKDLNAASYFNLAHLVPPRDGKWPNILLSALVGLRAQIVQNIGETWLPLDGSGFGLSDGDRAPLIKLIAGRRDKINASSSVEDMVNTWRLAFVSSFIGSNTLTQTYSQANQIVVNVEKPGRKRKDDILLPTNEPQESPIDVKPSGNRTDDTLLPANKRQELSIEVKPDGASKKRQSRVLSSNSRLRPSTKNYPVDYQTTKRWSQQETKALEKGLALFQKPCWTKILKMNSDIFQPSRTVAQLYSKAMYENRKRSFSKKRLGGFAFAKNSRY